MEVLLFYDTSKNSLKRSGSTLKVVELRQARPCHVSWTPERSFLEELKIRSGKTVG